MIGSIACFLESPQSRITEQEIIDKLTSHATHIAESVLSQSESGQLLEEDIRVTNTTDRFKLMQWFEQKITFLIYMRPL